MINQLYVSLFLPFYLESFCDILKLISVDSLCKHCNYFEVSIIKMSQSSSKSKANGGRKQERGGEEGSSKEKRDNFCLD